MTRAPMHVNPGHPAWRRIPLALACLLALLTGALVLVALQGDTSAWSGAVILAPVTGLWGWGYYSIRKEQRSD